jgi:hypothetical protein
VLLPEEESAFLPEGDPKIRRAGDDAATFDPHALLIANNA